MKKLIAAILPLLTFTATAGKYTAFVDPFIGTGRVDGALSGNNHPGATTPYGLVQLGPDTHPAPDWFNASGYDYNDNRIYGFSHTRLSGTGASDLIDISIFPTTSGKATSSAFGHEGEKASPGYYSVKLDDEGILAEMTATTRTGLHRYTYPNGADTKVIVDLDRSAQKGSWDRKIINSQIKLVNPTLMTGYRVITGWAKLRKVYFAIEFAQPVVDCVLTDGNTERKGATVVNGRELRALLTFDAPAQQVEMRVGISAVSPENALENLRTETAGKTFDMVKAEAEAAWDHELGRIEVEGDPEKMKIFYTALYHTMFQPNTFSDVNGEYMTPIYTVGKLPVGETYYTTFSLWDTYRAAHPLYSLIDPERNAGFVNSMLRHFDDYGYLPIWELWGQDNYCMIGNHAIPVVVDAVLKGTPGVDAQHAWEAVKQSSVNSHPNSPFDVWEKYHFMPEPLQTQSVSITLEMAYNDWCVAQLAKFLGKDDDYTRFINRSGFYKNLYDRATGFFRAKDENGNFTEPFDPLKYGANGGYPFTEGNAWQYFWYVPHDIEAFVEITGGKKAFEKKLDTFFTLTDSSGEKNDNISGQIGQYAHGNEPSHHVAYLYNDVDAPAKSQKMIGRIMNEMYNTSTSGYAGNDDCGEMSAWYVFSAMGFYPVNPASGEYYIGIPAFDNIVINLPEGKKFVIKATGKKPAGAQDATVKRVSLNGNPMKSLRLSHSAITGGGTLDFSLN